MQPLPWAAWLRAAVPVSAPVAHLVGVPVSAAPATPWNFDGTAGDKGAIVRPRRRRISWMGPLFLLLFLGIIGGGIAFAWVKEGARIQRALAAFQGSQNEPQAAVTPEKDKSTVVASASTSPATTATEPRIRETDTPEHKVKPDVTPKPEEKVGPTTPPIKDPVKTPEPPKEPIKKPDPVKPPPPSPPPVASPFPRRALIISVHNYLFANPITAGDPAGRTISKFKEALSPGKTRDDKWSVGLNIAPDQVQHLSDVTANPSLARPPLKQTIESTLTNFLRSARAQDHVMVFFIGHSAEIDGQIYLAPIEGALDNAATLIPLRDVLDQMGKCRAKQKVLVLDVNRFSPTKGSERPGSGPMGAKFEALIKNPPAGVQVWASCRAGEQSYETDTFALGHFLNAIYTVLRPDAKEKEPALSEGKIQRAADPLPMEQLEKLVNGEFQKHLEPFKITQQSLLTGAPLGDNAVAYDPMEPLNPLPPLPDPTLAPGHIKVVRAVLAEIGLPPVKASREDNSLRFDLLPAFPPARLAEYEVPGGEPPAETAKLRQTVQRARVLLWAASADAGTKFPDDIANDVKAKQAELKLRALPTLVRDGYPKPNNDKQFKDQIFNDEREVARIMGPLIDIEQDLQDIKQERDKECKRWQANYDFVLARVEAEIAYLYEYQSMLGQMRKDAAPPLNPPNIRWKLAAVTTLSGDSNGKRAAKNALKLYDSIIKENPGTPWEVLAKREKLTALGLEWKPSSK